MSDDVLTAVFQIKQQVGEMSSTLQSIQTQAEAGRMRAKSFEQYMRDELAKKVDRTYISPIMKINWLLKNPRVILLLFSLLVFLGVVTVNVPIIQMFKALK